MLQNKLKPQKGFTIIEVLIVLAIAGLILLIVFLAVPQLQRNARNSAIKSDAAALIGGISSFQSNADGARVVEIDSTGKVCAVAGCATGITEQAKLQGGTTVATITAAPTGVIAHGTLSVWLGHDCKNNGNARSNAVWYSIETSSAETAANNNKCLEA